MYIATSTRTNDKWELESLDELLYELDILNTKNKRLKKEEEILVYKTNQEGEILETYNIALPANTELDDIFKVEEKSKESTLKNIDEKTLTSEELEVFRKLEKRNNNKDSEGKPNPKKRQREIIEELQRQKLQEKEERRVEKFEKQSLPEPTEESYTTNSEL